MDAEHLFFLEECEYNHPPLDEQVWQNLSDERFIISFETTLQRKARVMKREESFRELRGRETLGRQQAHLKMVSIGFVANPLEITTEIIAPARDVILIAGGRANVGTDRHFGDERLDVIALRFGLFEG